MFFETAHGMRPAPLIHNPFNALVCPRPIGWISTVDSSGAHNLAPFSYFNAVSSDPPYVVFAPNSPNANRTKDTYRNVNEVPEFVANFVSVADAEAMNASSKDYPHGADEFAACGIAAAPSRLVRPQRVAIAKAALECRVFQIVNLPKTPDGRQNNVVIGEVVGIHVADDVIVDGRVDEALLAPLSRLGYMNYGVLGRIFAMDRPA
ncbi:MAG: flavin reductase family protein [Gammaproteobacteria bacterium]|nr:flavin reductase family protein [Gammaproteobacteria bacterium]